MPHAKTDSDLTSSAPSSPPRSPRRPVYYVQSPSRDSHDESKTNLSFHSTPIISPRDSPPHSHSSHSTSTRFSASHRKQQVKVNGRRKGGDRTAIDVIEEEGLLEDDEERGGIPRRCYFPIFVLAFFALFTFFSLILWGASRSQKPKVEMKTITFENFNIQAGTDASLVPTDMATLNSTVKFSFRNTGSFFGVHVRSTPVDISYSQLKMASGDIKEFYQSRKSQRNVNVVVMGSRVPLYGGGADLTSVHKPNATIPPVPLKLSFSVKSRAYVLGKLVKPKFIINVECLVKMDQQKLNKPVSLKNKCQIN